MLTPPHNKGMIDTAAEIKKLQKNLEKTNGQLVTLQKRMTAKEYMTKVPENVRKGNDERVSILRIVGEGAEEEERPGRGEERGEVHRIFFFD